MQLNDVILVHSDKTPRSMWRMGVVTELIKGKMDNIIRGALKRFSNNTLLKQPVNKLYPIENVRSNRQEPSDTENLAKINTRSCINRGVTMKICRMNNSRNIGPRYLMGSVKTAVREYCCITPLTFFYFFINTCKYFSWKEVVLQSTSIATKWICQAIASSSKVLRVKIESMTKKTFHYW